MIFQSCPSKNDYGEEKKIMAYELTGIRHLKHGIATNVKFKVGNVPFVFST